MNKIVFPWNKPSNPLPNGIDQLKVECQCMVREVFIKNSKSLANIDKQVIKTNDLVLQIRQSHIILYDRHSKQIIDFFQCNISINFVIRHPNEIYQQSIYIGNQQNKTFSFLQFAHSDCPEHQCTFIVSLDYKKHLESFGMALEKCQIIQKDFHKQFKPLRKLAKGSTASVFSAIRIRDSQIVAIKAFNKSSHFAMSNGKGKKAFQKEIKILIQCCDQNLCQFQGVFETGNTIYIAMKNYDKTLSSVLYINRPLSRDWVVSAMEDLLRGVSYLHSKGIMHRDLKLENIMLQKSQGKTKAVIIDLGMAEYFGEQSYLFQQCGTPGFAAPQIFGPRGLEPQKCDIFSLGVVFHIMLFKRTIFEGTNKEEILLNNRDAKIYLETGLLDQQDENLKDLLLRMLEVDPLKRISAAQALNHNLFNSKISTPTLTSTSLEMSQTRMLSLNQII